MHTSVQNRLYNLKPKWEKKNPHWRETLAKNLFAILWANVPAKNTIDGYRTDGLTTGWPANLTQAQAQTKPNVCTFDFIYGSLNLPFILISTRPSLATVCWRGNFRQFLLAFFFFRRFKEILNWILVLRLGLVQ